MKRLIFAFFILSTFVYAYSCAKDELKIVEPIEQTNEYAVSLDEALNNLNKTLDWIDKPTRGAKRQVATISTISRKDVFGQTTRSDAESTENLLYVVNFENDEGYAILGADSRLEPVLLVADSGNADPADYTDPGTPEDIYLQDSIRPGSVDDPFAQYWCAEDEDHYLGNDGTPDIPSLLLGYTERVPIWLDPDPKDDGGGIPSGPVSPDVPTPLLNTAWHQRAPFNDHIHIMPPDEPGYVEGYETDNDPYTNNRRLAGCTTIATAQLIAYLGTRGAVTHDYELTSSWNDITKTEQERINSENQAVIEEDIAKMVKDIADGIDVKYNYWGSDGTYATPRKIKNYLNSIGFDASKSVGYTTEIVTTNLRDGKPVIIGALGRHNGDISGHAWVIDGFKYDNNHNISMVHCNMGWNKGNGWYSNKVFSTNSDTNEYDLAYNYDADPQDENCYQNGTPTNTYHYTWWFRMVYIKDSVE